MGQTERQVRHFYVANKFEISDGFTPDKHLNEKGDLGEMKAFINDSKNHLYFEYRGKGGVTRSDLIPINNIEYVNISKKEDLRVRLQAKKLIFKTPKEGNNFLINLKVSGLRNLNESDKQQASSQVTHIDSDNGVNYKRAAIQLAKGVNRALYNVVDIFVSDSDSLTEPGTLTQVTEKTTLKDLESVTVKALVVKEAKPLPWNDINRYTRINFELEAPNVKEELLDIVTLKLDYTNEDNYVKNGILVKDDEYFYIGVRGQVYEGGSTKVPSSQGVADESKEYDILDIHYSHVDSGNTSYKSEKDITIAGKKEELEKIIESLKGAKTTHYVAPADPKKGPLLEEC